MTDRGNAGQTPPDRSRRQIPWIWWLILAGLVVWNLVALLASGGPSRLELSYSEFLDQVRADNVVSVEIAGSSITGVLRVPIPAPEAPGTTTTTAGATQPTFGAFSTRFPEAIGDPDLLPLLEAHGVEVVVEAPPNQFLAVFLANVLPLVLLVGLLWWLGKRSMAGQMEMFNFGKSKARTYSTERPDVTFDDIAGADEAKEDLRQVVEFLRDPEKYRRLGARLPRGFLLVGPPGTGKTLLARAVAGEAAVPFLFISASEFVEMFVGVGASRVRDLFAQAKKQAPSIVFIDELDAVGRRRGAGVGTVNDEREQTLNQLLTEMDGFDERDNIVVLAATNRPDVLDPALLRPGRFDRQIVVPMPDREAREQILRIHTKKMKLSDQVDLADLAAETVGMSGADLANLANEAALQAAVRGADAVEPADFDKALDKILLGGERHTVMHPDDRRVVAYHEGGHTIVAWYSPEADPVSKVTIVPHGRALGVTAQLPEEDRYNYSRGYLLTRLAVMLGGRSAEEAVFDEVTTGAESDLVEATKLARRMVTRWGMGSFGPVALSTDEEQPFLGYELTKPPEVSEATQAEIDRNVHDLIEGQHGVARSLIETHRDQLDRLAEALLDHETVHREELERILGPRPSRNEGT